MNSSGTLASIEPESIERNPRNPRRYFNEERLDLLRTSIQEVGILVPLIVYQQNGAAATAAEPRYVLMDGERRWRCALDLGLDAVPANVIPAPSELDNLLRMFNIHNVREDWPLISVALSLNDVIELSGESGEKRLAEMTGLTRSTVRRARRLLSIPPAELQLIQEEAHLERTQQVHREDLYLEIEAAESVLRSELPEIAAEFSRDQVIRQFAAKAEVKSLRAVTDFRYVGRLVKAADEDVVTRDAVVDAARTLITQPTISPHEVFDEVAALAYRQHTIQRKAELLADDLRELFSVTTLSPGLLDRLRELRDLIDRLGGEE
ncbi:MAG: ParB/RepB/Spo0J family partition protein [Gaiella sp.]|nr:ParB/RepB/Spo0J family partition protein [Gaiella sp.]